MNVAEGAVEVVKMAPQFLERLKPCFHCVAEWIRFFLHSLQQLGHPEFKRWPFSSKINCSQRLTFQSSISLRTSILHLIPLESGVLQHYHPHFEQLIQNLHLISPPGGLQRLILLFSIPSLLQIVIYMNNDSVKVKRTLNCILVSQQYLFQYALFPFLPSRMKLIFEEFNHERSRLAEALLATDSTDNDSLYLSLGVYSMEMIVDHLISIPGAPEKEVKDFVRCMIHILGCNHGPMISARFTEKLDKLKNKKSTSPR